MPRFGVSVVTGLLADVEKAIPVLLDVVIHRSGKIFQPHFLGAVIAHGSDVGADLDNPLHPADLELARHSFSLHAHGAFLSLR